MAEKGNKVVNEERKNTDSNKMIKILEIMKVKINLKNYTKKKT